MRPDQIERLEAQRVALAQVHQRMLDTPESERPTQPKALKAWLADMEATRRALEQLQQILQAGQRAADREAHAARRAEASEPVVATDHVVLAVIPKGIGSELQVSVQTWKGRRTFDVRVYAAGEGGTMQPTRKGIKMDAKRLPALLEALKKAAQHV